VLDTRRPLCAVLPAVLLCLWASTGHAQDAAADKAKALFQQGQDQFQAKKYKEAQTSLMAEAAWDTLPAAQQKQRGALLDQVGPAIKSQAAAEESISGGEKALAAGDLAGAEKAFADASASEFLPDAGRKAATDQLALVRQRMAAAKTASAGLAVTTTVPAVDAAAASTVADRPAAQSVDPADNPALKEMERSLEVRRSKARFDIQEADKRAREVLARAASEAEFDAAAQASTAGENVLTANKGIFAPDDARQLQEQLDGLARLIALKRGNWERENSERVRREIIVQEQQRQSRQREDLRREVDRYIAEARLAERKKDYEHAVDLWDKVLKIDPANYAARDSRNIVEQTMLLRRERGYAEDVAREQQKVLVDLRESETPWYELLRYPKDWREITARRVPFGANAGVEGDEQNRVAALKLRKRINGEVKFDKQRFDLTVNFLREVTGVNMTVKWEAIKVAGVQPDTEVNGVLLQDVTAEKALRTALEAVSGADQTNGLTYLLDEGVVTISTKTDLSGPRYRTTQVYDIRDLIISVPTFQAPRMDLNLGSGTNDTSNGNGTMFNTNACTATNNNNQQSREDIVKQIVSLITSKVDKNSWAPTGDLDPPNEFGGQLIITQTPENHRAILSLINKLREAKALQITIECRFLSVNTGFLSTVGLDLQMYLNIGSSLGGAGRSAPDPVTGATVPLRGASTWQTAGADLGPVHPSLTPMGIRQDTMGFATTGLQSPISGGVASIGGSVSTPALNVTGTYLDDLQVDYIINATQAHSLSRSLTAPRVTIQQGVRGAYVTFGTRQAYVSELVPMVSENAVALRPVVSSIPTGTVLAIDECAVSADRRYVTLTISPTITSLNGFTNYFINVSGVDPNSGAARTGTGSIQLPNVTVQGIETQVSIPDGGTLLMGGLKSTGELEREKGAPLLDKIPVIRRFFENRGKVRDEQTILILIKPRIIIQSEEEEKAFPSSG
jgi:type II secretory pathway component GspD/PulD (secretin)